MIKKIIFIVALSFSLQWVAAQTVSDDQVVKMIMAEKEHGANETDIARKLLQKGVTPAQLRRIKDKYEKENEGLPAARKTGMEYVTGDYVWHIDSDDWLEEDAAGRIAECAMKTEADLIYFNFYKEYDGKTRLQVENDYSGKPKDVYQRDMYNHKAYGCTWNKCVKRSLYLDNDIYFPQYSYAEDICLMAQLVGYADKIAFLDAPLYHYRKNNPDSVTRQYRRERCREAAMNLMSLYCHYGVESNPAAPIIDDVFYKVGFYSAIYDFNFFDRYAFLADKILEAKMLRRSYIWIHLQLILKIYAFFRSRR